MKQPILIYDSQVRNALGTNDGDLEVYYTRWHQEFDTNKSEIEKVCSLLQDLSLYTVDQEIGTRDYIAEVSSQSWFHERVLDIYLWNKGNIRK